MQDDVVVVCIHSRMDIVRIGSLRVQYITEPEPEYLGQYEDIYLIFILSFCNWAQVLTGYLQYVLLTLFSHISPLSSPIVHHLSISYLLEQHQEV